MQVAVDLSIASIATLSSGQHLCAAEVLAGLQAYGKQAIIKKSSRNYVVPQEEVERLRSILVRFPTGEDQDAALLESGKLTDWRERVIVKFRMLRKRALRLTMEVPDLAIKILHISSGSSG